MTGRTFKDRNPRRKATTESSNNHKSQGAEFPVMVAPLAMQQYMLLQRDLVYTGITRGKKLVVLIGQQKALGMAVGSNRTENRFFRIAGQAGSMIRRRQLRQKFIPEQVAVRRVNDVAGRQREEHRPARAADRRSRVGAAHARSYRCEGNAT